MATPKLQLIPIAKVVESPFNPRKHFDPAAQKLLEKSMQTHGQLTPGTVRPAPRGTFELAAGHRRRRALEKNGATHFLAVVRDMTDVEFIEILTIENDEREDVHPLEQAAGYRLLMEKAGYDVGKIAARIDRSFDYVRDRLHLLDLIPELKEHFLAARFGISQAIILAKLTPDEQRKVSEEPGGGYHSDSGLWRNSGPTLDEKVFPLVARTAPELEAWIAKYLRFDEKKAALEIQFPETAALLETAKETGARVVAITRDDHIREEAKDKGGERTFTRNSWKRADELEGSKSCQYAIVGVVKVGEGRGEAMGVCLSRERCLIHWPKEAKAFAARQKQAKTPAKKADPAAEKRAVAAAAARAAKEEREALIVKAAADALRKELDARVANPSAGVVEACQAVLAKTYKAPAGITAGQLLVLIAANQGRHYRLELAFEGDGWYKSEIARLLKPFGLNPTDFLKAAQKKSAPEKAAPAAAAS